MECSRLDLDTGCDCINLYRRTRHSYVFLLAFPPAGFDANSTMATGGAPFIPMVGICIFCGIRCHFSSDSLSHPINADAMSESLSQSQQQLRGRKLGDMSEDQLRDWIDACRKMELWVKASKSRRAWRLSGLEAQKLLDLRKPPPTNPN